MTATELEEQERAVPVEFYEVVIRHYIDAGKGFIQLEEPLVYRCAINVLERGNPYLLGEIMDRISHEVIRKAAQKGF